MFKSPWARRQQGQAHAKEYLISKSCRSMEEVRRVEEEKGTATASHVSWNDEDFDFWGSAIVNISIYRRGLEELVRINQHGTPIAL